MDLLLDLLLDRTVFLDSNTTSKREREHTAVRELDEYCELCGDQVPDSELTLLSFRNHHKCCCSKCFNETVGKMYGIDFQHPAFEPLTVADRDGVPHEFHFRTLLLPTHVSLEATEIIGGRREGHEFQVTGPLEEDILTLFGKLFERIRRALSTKPPEAGDAALNWKSPVDKKQGSAVSY